MPKFVRPERVATAVKALADWRARAKSQQAMHLWPLLALVRGRVTKATLHKFTESDEFAFWDALMRLPGDDRPSRDDANAFTKDYYVEPLLLSLKPSDYPHRSPWTIRNRTFFGSWKAADADESRENWKLASNYAAIVVDKVLTRGDEINRVPVVDLAAWLFREKSFPDDATSQTLQSEFQREFPFEGADYIRIFEFAEEDEGNLFTGEKPTDQSLRAEIEAVLLRPDLGPPPAPTPMEPIDEDDPIYMQVKELLDFGASGIIFRGCPGTSKTWYAKRIANHLVSNPAHIYQCQFHPSYGYEDFVEGYRPDATAKSGFAVTDKIFLEACHAAEGVPGYVVFIIDEINRGDPARVFGELLTYIESDYRGDKFRKAYSGAEASVPKNLLVFGTMNQFDRSITQLDLALTRRFANIDLKPDTSQVEAFLQSGAGFTPAQVGRVCKWFDALQSLLPYGIGHTYFKRVVRPADLKTAWHHFMLPYCESVLELEPPRLDDVRRSFDAMYRAVTGQGDGG